MLVSWHKASVGFQVEARMSIVYDHIFKQEGMLC